MNNSRSLEGANALASATNALRLLSMLSAAPSLRVIDVSRQLGIAPSTSHRLLACLKEEGFVQQARGSKRYLLGPEMLRLARHFSSQHSIERTAHPHLEALCREVSEAVNLQILLGEEVLCLDAVVEDKHGLHVKQIAGRRMAAHASAAGKLLIAALGKEERESMYAKHELSPVTEHTITDPIVFESEIKSVQKRGYATNLGEREEGIHAVAVGVLDLDENPIAALAVAAPAVRVPAARIPGLVEHLQHTSAAITADYFAIS